MSWLASLSTSIAAQPPKENSDSSGGAAAGGGDMADAAKRAAAYAAVNELPATGAVLESGDLVVGLGSGSTVVFVAERLAQRVRDGEIRVGAVVPTSFQARQLCIEHGLPLSDLERCPEIDCHIDGADEVVEAAGPTRLTLIKGGGGCQTGEKLVASASKRFIVVADDSKPSPALGTRWRRGVPIAVLPDARVVVARRLASLGAITVTLRMAKAKAGPVVDDYGCFILDAHFGAIADPAALEQAIERMQGVVSCGLFVGESAASLAYIGSADGTVREIHGE